ncbi:MAG: NAD(P)/FAD-dependent oxidoreductase [Thermomicrobiales bacterium]
MEKYDAIIIGAGHNGLIAAAYLAKAGKKVAVLERRHIIGGATVTEEHFPGYRLSTCSYVCSLLLSEVVRELELVKHGYDVRPFDPQIFSPQPDGSYFMSFLDGAKTREQLLKFSKRDADAWGPYWDHWERIIESAWPLIMGPPPGLGDLERAFDRPGGQDDLRLLLFGSVADILEHYFESEEIKGALATGGVIGSSLGPRSAGSAYVKFHHLLGKLDGHRGAWGYVRGGMGSIADAIAASAREAGAEILIDAEVAEIETSNGIATGVRLLDDRRFAAEAVISTADPHRTFLGMLDRETLPGAFVRQIEGLKTKGSVVKVLLGLGELPDFTAMPGTTVGPQHTGGIMICPSIDYIQRAWEDAKAGRPSTRPFMDCYIQSATEDGLAPPGKHTLSMFVQYAPYDLAEGDWESRRDEIGRNIIDTFAEYAPNLPHVIEHISVLGPPDIESEIGITGGNIFHGEITPDQMFNFRPATGQSGYQTPVERLYLGGSGVWPGGAVFGAPGRNSAREVLGSLTSASRTATA